MLVMPDELVLCSDEVKNVYVVRKYLDYIFKTENLIKNIYQHGKNILNNIKNSNPTSINNINILNLNGSISVIIV